MEGADVRTDGGQPRMEEGRPDPELRTSGGGAIGGAIVGGALGASYGPPGAVAGAILGAVLGDTLEEQTQKV